jgi:hypothetical protein
MSTTSCSDHEYMTLPINSTSAEKQCTVISNLSDQFSTLSLGTDYAVLKEENWSSPSNPPTHESNLQPLSD